MKLKGYAALHCTFYVARTAHAHIGFGYHESVGGLCHQFKALSRLFGNLKLRHKYAVALICATAYTSTQLVQLTQAESLGILNQHYCGVGHIHAYFYYSGGYKNLCFA